MTPQWYLAAYFAAALAALILLVIFRGNAWYLHVVSATLGMVAGLMPPIGVLGETFYLLAGVTFIFFTSWGFGGLFFRNRRHPPVPRRAIRSIDRADRIKKTGRVQMLPKRGAN
jgi:hypothetical protein